MSPVMIVERSGSHGQRNKLVVIGVAQHCHRFHRMNQLSFPQHEGEKCKALCGIHPFAIFSSFSLFASSTTVSRL